MLYLIGMYALEKLASFLVSSHLNLLSVGGNVRFEVITNELSGEFSGINARLPKAEISKYLRDAYFCILYTCHQSLLK